MGGSSMLIVFTSYLFCLKILLIITAVLILLSNIDDAFIDVYYIFNRIRRRFFFHKRIRSFKARDLMRRPEQNFAIMIPTWCEANVIGDMIRNSCHSYQYEKYHIFVGVYPNDHKTRAAIEQLIPLFPQVHLSLVSHDGPTSKADCLNHIHRDIIDFEHRRHLCFAGFVLHDAEDIVHPLELKLYNHLIPRKDMIQIPVIPLERPWYDLTGGHYQDEFAENHIKELVARESLTGHVPSAGVGTALSRRAMTLLAAPPHIVPFDTGNLTEDYDLSLRLRQYGLNLIFARFPAGRGSIIATREFFPNTMRSVIRQKSRWLMGIAFQGFRRQKWQGSLALKYVLLRDRKGIITAQLSLLAYFILVNILLVWLAEALMPQSYRYPPLVRQGEWLVPLLWANFAFLVNRGLHRIWFTYRTYGLLAGLFSVPRQLWGNILNGVASLRAILLYSTHLIRGTPLVWDKTDHAFPDHTQLKSFRQKLGDLLVHQDYINAKDLKNALRHQKNTGMPLGQMLLQNGYITPRQLQDTLRLQDLRHDHPG